VRLTEATHAKCSYCPWLIKLNISRQKENYLKKHRGTQIEDGDEDSQPEVQLLKGCLNIFSVVKHCGTECVIHTTTRGKRRK
jgi:hypothetical protein